MKVPLKFTLATAVPLVAAGIVYAESVPLANPSFEDPSSIWNTISLDDGIPGWQCNAETGRMIAIWTPNPESEGYAPTNGIQQLYMTGENHFATGKKDSYITQNLTSLLKPFYFYTLQVDARGAANQSVDVRIVLEFLNDDQVVASVNHAVLAGEWTTAELTFTTTDVLSDFSAIRISTDGVSALPEFYYDMNIDNIRLDAVAVPEPAALCLLAFGSLACLKRRG